MHWYKQPGLEMTLKDTHIATLNIPSSYQAFRYQHGLRILIGKNTQFITRRRLDLDGLSAGMF